MSFSPNEWEGPRLSRHQIMAGLSRKTEVVFVEPPTWLSKPEVPLQWADRLHQVSENLSTYRFAWWKGKLIRPNVAVAVQRSLRTRSIEQLIEGYGIRDVVLYFWHPKFVEYVDIDQLRPCRVVYHMYDDFSRYLSAPESPNREHGSAEIERQESRLLHRADVCFAVTKELCRIKGQDRDIVWDSKRC